MIEFTKNELVCIDDSLCNFESEENGVTDMRPLLLKVGRCLVGYNDALNLDEKELWVLRNCVNIDAQIGSEKVGLSIKMKVYEALLNIDYGKSIPIEWQLREEVSNADRNYARKGSDQSASQSTDA